MPEINEQLIAEMCDGDRRSPYAIILTIAEIEQWYFEHGDKEARVL